LIPTKWSWKVKYIGNNTFRIVFPNKTELQRMVKWGVVHSKFNNAKIKIGEMSIDNKVVKVLPKIWVQFNGRPNELSNFFNIWAVGSMLGITKDVDMVFTRKHDICRMQVLVLDPNLVPQFVDVVIADYLYTLQFKVGENGEEEEPQPMDMDSFHEEDDKQFEDMQEGLDSFGHTNNSQGKGGNAANGVHCEWRPWSEKTIVEYCCAWPEQRTKSGRKIK
jgi:hypothetical protein